MSLRNLKHFQDFFAFIFEFTVQKIKIVGELIQNFLSLLADQNFCILRLITNLVSDIYSFSK